MSRHVFSQGVVLAEARNQRDRARLERDAARGALEFVERWYFGHESTADMIRSVRDALGGENRARR